MADEYIKREDAVKSLLDYLAWHKTCGLQNAEFQSAINCCASRILNDNITIPAADVAPVHRGEWVEFDGEGTYQCTYCGEPFILIDGTPSDNEYNYCPKCGAYLREGLAGGEHHAE